MSLHDPNAARKPRRLGLYLPFVLLVLAIVAWTVFWIWARGETQKQMDAAVADLQRGGYQLGWSRRSVGGYPFRLDVTLNDATIRDPSGWALRAPVLEGEAFLYAPGHWMLATPQGLTLVRPAAGPVFIAGKLLHASLTDLSKRPPSFSFQGEGLSFQPSPGAEPFPLAAADLFELHLRAGPDDEGGIFARLDGGKARPDGALGRIAAGKPVSLVWNSTLSKMSAFAGDSWPDAVRRWTDAGGRMNVRDTSRLTAGDAVVAVKSGALDVGRDGRLRGVLDVGLRQAPRALGAMGDTGVLAPNTAEAASSVAAARQDGDSARATLNFEAGQVTLGPVALGPAPQVYTPR